MRILPWFVVGLLLVLPSVAASGTPLGARIVFTIEPPGSPVRLDEHGRGAFPLAVSARAENFACLQEATVVATLGFHDAFPTWGGASLNPNRATFKVPFPGPGLSDQWLGTSKPVLEVAWDLENVPAYASLTYTIGIDAAQFAGGGPCVPAPAFTAGPDVEITVVLGGSDPHPH